MNSPSSIDLDMNLLESSPVPPARRVDDSTDSPATREERVGRTSDGTSDNALESFHGAKRAEDSRLSIFATTGRENHSANITNDANSNESTKGGSNERSTIKNGGKPTAQNFESWRDDLNMMRDDLYMMNVKNSILLDDLVKLGADV